MGIEDTLASISRDTRIIKDRLAKLEDQTLEVIPKLKSKIYRLEKKIQAMKDKRFKEKMKGIV